MQAPKLPSMLKSPQNKRFNLIARYYDERKERLEEIKKGKTNHIQFKSVTSRSLNKNRSIRLISIFFIILFITLLILKQ